MIENGGYYIDENNNRWDMSKYTLQQVQNSNLVKCTGCINCFDCSDCSFCTDCVGCYNCKYCQECVTCSYCDYCKLCKLCDYLEYCINCTQCKFCESTANCDHVEESYQANNCKNSKHLIDCTAIEDMDSIDGSLRFFSLSSDCMVYFFFNNKEIKVIHKFGKKYTFDDFKVIATDEELSLCDMVEKLYNKSKYQWEEYHRNKKNVNSEPIIIWTGKKGKAND